MNQLFFQKAKNQFTDQVEQRDGTISVTLTKFVRNSINEIKIRQTHDLQSGLADETPEGISNRR